MAIKNKEISKLRKELDSKGEKIENYKTKVSEIRKEVMQNPQLLVGKRVVHYFEEDGTRQGYFGVVIGLVPGTRTWFNISYDEEGNDEIHTFELLDDYRDGDLEILYS